MIKKTVTYEDFNGETVTEDLYFHLSKAQLVRMEAEYPEGLGAHLQGIIDSENKRDIVAMFEKLVLDSYGVRSEDGKRFVRNPIIRSEFEASEAYSEIFMDLITSTDAMIEFFNGIMPSGLDVEIAGADLKAVPDPEPDPEKIVDAPKTITYAQAQSLSHDELMEKLRQGYNIQDMIET